MDSCSEMLLGEIYLDGGSGVATEGTEGETSPDTTTSVAGSDAAAAVGSETAATREATASYR